MQTSFSATMQEMVSLSLQESVITNVYCAVGFAHLHILRY